jgi:DNA invertase Pin-like site-specific DNA recombinase
MATYGYHRTSTKEQHLDRGINAITEYCKSNSIDLVDIFTDQQTGKNFERPEYQFLKKRILTGDCIICSETDRLGRDKESTLKELQYYKEKGVRVKILEIPTTLIDYSTMDNSLAKMMMETINNLLIEMYATFAHAEMEKRERRQSEGIRAKKERGEWDDYGRPRAIDFDVFKEAYEKVIRGEMKPFECAKSLGLKVSTFYKYKARYEKEVQSA